MAEEFDDYTPITEDETNPEAPGTSSLWKRWWKNPIAAFRGALGAPIVRAGWHPFNANTIGGGATGLIYDSAVHGSVATITSPDFEDGFEYRFKGVDISNGAGDDLQVNFYRETSAGYAGVQTLRTSPAGTSTFSFDLTLSAPRLIENTHTIFGAVLTAASGNSISASDVMVSRSVHHATAQKLLRAQFRNNLRNIAAGRIYMYRRLLP